jgi:hypothetical protein
MAYTQQLLLFDGPIRMVEIDVSACYNHCPQGASIEAEKQLANQQLGMTKQALVAGWGG